MNITVQSDKTTPTAPNLAQKITARLGLEIMRGDIATGELLPTENELCESLGVSRSVVREAFKLLAAKGMIRSRRRKGTTVCSVEDWNVLDPEILHWMEESDYSYQILHELIQIRMAIEPEASAIVAHQREITDFSTMSTALRILEESGIRYRSTAGSRYPFSQRYSRCHAKPLLQTDETLAENRTGLL